jgi:(p)ppGpp synthase/HD superfamily hydrolase
VVFEVDYKKQIEQARDLYKSNAEHYINTAKLLYEKKADPALITAAFFHGVKFYDIPQQNYKIDGEVRELVHHFQQHFKSQERVEFKSNLEDITLNPKIFLLRLMDQKERVSNPRTSEKKRLEAADRILKIYAPLAELMGLHEMASEIKNTAFAVKQPVEYERIKSFIEKQNFEEKLDEIKKVLVEKLENAGLKFTLSSRVKSPASIFYKKRKINDYIGVRVIVDDMESVEKASVIVKSLGGLVEEKDYIKNKKPNGYQSLHLIMEGEVRGEKTPFEVQIRTKEMDDKIQQSEDIKHAFYKSGLNKQLDPKMEVIKKANHLIDQKRESEAWRLIEKAVRYDLINVKVKVGGAEFDLNLPKNSTVLDAAFNLPKNLPQMESLNPFHIGHYVKGSLVNNKNVGKDSVLKDGDELVLRVGRKAQKHSLDLLRKVVTSNALKGLKENEEIFSKKQR